MGALLLKLRTWWETADRTQKAVTLFGSAFLLLLLSGTYYFASRPKMETLFGGLSAAEAGSISNEIQKMGIPVESDMQGNIRVPSDKLSEVRNALAVAGKSPTTGHVGNEELAKLSAMTTPSVEKERLKTIIEGELARSIEGIDGVASARVHITLGERTAFMTEQKPASASIFIQEKAQGGVGGGSAKAIATMVANAVPGLSVNKVFVLDNAGRTLFDGNDQETGNGQANQKLDTERQEAMRRERDIQAKLDAVIGAGNSVVTVNCEMDFDRTKVTSEDLKPTKDPITSESGVESIANAGATSNGGGIPGPGPNGATPSTPPEKTPDGKPYYGDKKKEAYGYRKTEKEVVNAVGTVKSLAIAVLVNQDKVQDTTPVKEFLTNYIGGHDGFKAEVTAMKFDTKAADDAKLAIAANASRETMQQVMSMLPVGALLIVGFLVMKALAKTAKASSVMVHALPNGTLMASGGRGAGSAASESFTHDSHTAHHAEADVANGIQALAKRNDYDDVASIEERQNLPLEQLKRMANERPESVAMLIKSWMLEERR